MLIFPGVGYSFSYHSYANINALLFVCKRTLIVYWSFPF